MWCVVHEEWEDRVGAMPSSKAGGFRAPDLASTGESSMNDTDPPPNQWNPMLEKSFLCRAKISLGSRTRNRGKMHGRARRADCQVVRVCD